MYKYKFIKFEISNKNELSRYIESKNIDFQGAIFRVKKKLKDKHKEVK